MAKVGRPPMYTPERVAKICKAIEEGQTNEVAAKIGGITDSTFYAWLKEKKDFLDAVKKARDTFEDWQLNGILEDAKRSLKQLICGLEYTETKTEYLADAKGNPTIKKQTTINKRVLPSATAVIFALCNRDPDHWQNRVSNEITGKLQTEDKADISLKNVPDDLLAQVIEAINKK